MRELLIGCGNSRRKKLHPTSLEFENVTTIDHDPDCGADILHDLNVTPWPVESDAFDEVHAYEVLEHLGRQGDAVSFFAAFGEIWRALKHGGRLYATVPSWKSEWAWGDPSHTRVITPGSLSFLNQQAYIDQVGKTAMTDFRGIWHGDFEPWHIECNDHAMVFCLEAVKPSRWQGKSNVA